VTVLNDAINAMSIYGHDAVLWTLVAASGVTLTVTIERWLYGVRGRTRSKELRELSPQSVPMDAAALARAEEGDGFEGHVLAAGLRAGRLGGSEAAEEAMAATLSAEQEGLDSRLNIIGTVGANAPFVGLLGTVLGIVKAFQDLALDSSEGTSAVMTGISEALIATAVGLLVAIPAVVLYNALTRRNESILRRLEQTARVVLLQLEVESYAENDEKSRRGA